MKLQAAQPPPSDTDTPDELQELESSLAFERATVAELRLEAHHLRVLLHLARIELAEFRRGKP